MRPLLLLFFCACRLGSARHGGEQPRVTNDITVAVYTSNDEPMQLARNILARDHHITVTQLDATGIEKFATECTKEGCFEAATAACARAAAQGADYYAVGREQWGFTSHFECLAGGGGDLHGHGEECTQSRTTDVGAAAEFRIDVYDARTCKPYEPLSRKVDTWVAGPNDTAKPEALRRVHEKAARLDAAVAEQSTIDEQGHASGEDGDYAVYRNGDYRGFVRVRGGDVSSLMLGLSPRTGDRLVRRGRREYIDLAPALLLGSARFDGAHETTLGIGAQVRYYHIDGGLQLGAGADIQASVSTTSTVYSGEIGWGVRVARGIVVSANAGGGLTSGTQIVMNSNASSNRVPLAVVTLRVQTFLATWFHVTLDVGYIHGADFDHWDGPTAAGARPMAIRGPFVRLGAGLGD